MTSAQSATAPTYAGLFIVTLATLMYEILLTRIFSVTMWYHFAFVAISVALFGMTVGALLVYLVPSRFPVERTQYHLGLSALLFAISIVLSFLTHLSIPFVPARSLVFLYAVALTYAVISIPFIFSGICVCLALTRYPQQVSKLYAADLAGAAAGSFLLIYLLEITDGPTAVIVIGFLASLAAVCFASERGLSRLGRVALVTCLVLGVSATVHTVLVAKQSAILRLAWVKGRFEPRPLYEGWNSFSRIKVSGDPSTPQAPKGWGMSPVYRSDRKIRQLRMDIDASASTVLTAFDGDVRELEYLKFDITNLVHYIRPDSNVLVIGSGGGRDILSALVFNQRSVLGIEINQDIIETVNGRFGSFTGHLDRHPNVRFVADEARSYIARRKEKFDIIHVSLIDSWAATAAGAYVLTENALYTVEAWKLFLDRLTPDGVLTFSRWYFSSRPDEVYRLTSLATAALQALGVENPRNHIAIAGFIPSRGEGRKAPVGVGTILVGRSKLSDRDLTILEDVTARLQFELVLSPRSSLDPTILTIAAERNLQEFSAKFPLNIAPPTDDNPFFFHMLRLRDVFNWRLLSQAGPQIHNFIAVFVLAALLITVVTLTLLCIVVPLVLKADRPSLQGAWPLFIFFAGIGLGYILVEISQMQRLIIFLGHPTYSLSVVLFALLSSSGLGSYLTRGISLPDASASAIGRLLLLLLALAGFGVLTPHAVKAFQESETAVRVVVAAGILIPLGLFMGMAFPLGMKLASHRAEALTPWLWGINGATSVCASVLAVTIALNSSITSSFWVGVACYGVAIIGFIWTSLGTRVLRQVSLG